MGQSSKYVRYDLVPPNKLGEVDDALDDADNDDDGEGDQSEDLTENSDDDRLQRHGFFQTNRQSIYQRPKNNELYQDLKKTEIVDVINGVEPKLYADIALSKSQRMLVRA